MSAPAKIFRRRLWTLVALLIVAVLACISLAVVAHRHFSGTLRTLASVELEAGRLSRQFRADLDDLHGALLRVGTESGEASGAVIQQRRQQLNEWLARRQAMTRDQEERNVLDRLAAEIRAYFLKLDGVINRPGGLDTPLDRDTLVMFDDAVIRLQSLTDDFTAEHQQDLRDLLQASLGSLLWMRNLVFGCLALLVAAVVVVVVLLYRDVVRPLREQLVDRESLLQKREKLAALGTLAAGVAHEIRNPLTAIKARLYTLRRTLKPGGAHEDVAAITGEVDRLERIVRDVLGYARPAEPTRDRVELSAWLREFAGFAEPEVTARGITFACTVSTTAVVGVDGNQLRQVMLNLVRNAQEALDGRRGRIEVALHREQIELRGRRADVAVLTVTDDGPGIPPEIQSRLFDPFFTTKAAGTGLGLSIVARLVENHGGEITFQSAPGSGTRFAVRLPLSENGQHATPS